MRVAIVEDELHTRKEIKELLETTPSLKGATIVAICDILEVACVYIAYKMTDCALLQPVRFTRVFLGMIMGYVFLHEKINTYQFIGAIIVVSANIFSIIYERRREKRAKR